MATQRKHRPVGKLTLTQANNLTRARLQVSVQRAHYAGQCASAVSRVLSNRNLAGTIKDYSLIKMIMNDGAPARNLSFMFEHLWCPWRRLGLLGCYLLPYTELKIAGIWTLL